MVESMAAFCLMLFSCLGVSVSRSSVSLEKSLGVLQETSFLNVYQ